MTPLILHQELDAAWKEIEEPVANYLETTLISCPDYMMITRVAHIKFSTPNGPDYYSSRESSPFPHWYCEKYLYYKFAGLIRENLKKHAQVLKGCSGEEFLSAFKTGCERYLTMAKKFNFLFSRLNRPWLRDLAREVKDFYQIDTLFFVQWSTVLVSEGIPKNLLYAIRQMPENNSTVAQVLNSLDKMAHPIPDPTKPYRAVFLEWSVPIRSLSTYFTDKSIKMTSLYWFKALCHWRLIVVSEDRQKTGVIFEIGVESRLQRRKSTPKKSKWDIGQLGGQGIFLGCTYCNDEEIMDYANEVMTRLGDNYDPLFNNCQEFCDQLLPCLKVPLHVGELFKDIEDLPYTAREKVVCQRFEDFTLRPSIIKMTLNSMPTLIRAWFFRILLAIGTGIVLKQEQVRFFIAWTIAVWYCGPKANIGIPS
ncbi:hypothetical protein F5Y10DRAFT_248400 [Nemania abortiva]|nr:hypothetical protein F5Y10DRAFT_248400 [Nemania abortiva]